MPAYKHSPTAEVRDSPHLFGNALRRELTVLTWPQGTRVSYINDILICSPTKEASDYHSSVVIKFLGEKGYRVSSKKAQISKQKVQSLGYELTPGHHSLLIERKRAIIELGSPATKKQL